MKLHELKAPDGSSKNRRRVGRGSGSGRGKTCGRGNKGLGSRSGGKVKVWYEGGQMPLQRRLPKKGFRPFRKIAYQLVNIRDLERFPDAMEYDPVSMQELGLIKSAKKPVKILGNGETTRKIQVKANSFTDSAREKITAAGGMAEVL